MRQNPALAGTLSTLPVSNLNKLDSLSVAVNVWPCVYRIGPCWCVARRREDEDGTGLEGRVYGRVRVDA